MLLNPRFLLNAPEVVKLLWFFILTRYGREFNNRMLTRRLFGGRKLHTGVNVLEAKRPVPTCEYIKFRRLMATPYTLFRLSRWNNSSRNSRNSLRMHICEEYIRRQACQHHVSLFFCYLDVENTPSQSAFQTNTLIINGILVWFKVSSLLLLAWLLDMYKFDVLSCKYDDHLVCSPCIDDYWHIKAPII